jgi:hypothetical protein
VDDAHGIGNRQFPLAHQPVAQRLAGDKRHHVEKEVALRTGAEHREDVRMLQLYGDFDFLPEPRCTDLTGELWRQELDHHLAAERHLGGQEEATHAAAAQLLLYVVGVSEGTLQAGQKVHVSR